MLDIAQYLGVSTDSVYWWVECRGLPVHRVRRLMRFTCSEVDQWVRSEDDGSRGEDVGKSASHGAPRGPSTTYQSINPCDLRVARSSKLTPLGEHCERVTSPAMARFGEESFEWPPRTRFTEKPVR